MEKKINKKNKIEPSLLFTTLTTGSTSCSNTLYLMSSAFFSYIISSSRCESHSNNLKIKRLLKNLISSFTTVAYLVNKKFC